eukprot:TRINITY_DN774021_c0_g1_i1.p1 TRINITY_DN774021_c0_g1~~TRINITY_DN774021_c0_g1_i1.p1  ORF type:complete len:1162 (+),score=431.12 TRINITY_DN774021_c0_g1_i1:118-3603(+)
MKSQNFVFILFIVFYFAQAVDFTSQLVATEVTTDLDTFRRVITDGESIFATGETFGNIADFIGTKGATGSGTNDVVLAKFSEATGDTEWISVTGPDDVAISYGYALALDIKDDKNLIVFGGTTNTDIGMTPGADLLPGYDYYYSSSSIESGIRTDTGCAVEGGKSTDDSINDIIITDDSWYVAGNYGNDGFIQRKLRNYPYCNQEWEQTFTSGKIERVLEINDRILVAGVAIVGDSTDILVSCVWKSNGEIAWEERFGSSENDSLEDMIYDGENLILSITTNNAFRKAGSGGDLESHLGGSDAVLVVMSPTGVYLKSKQMGTSVNDNAVGVTFFGGDLYFAITSKGRLDGGTVDGVWRTFLMKLDESFEPVWTYDFQTDFIAKDITAIGNKRKLFLVGSLGERSTIVSYSLSADGIKESGEECDDGNFEDFDGCNSASKIENGWTCFEGTATSPSVCQTTCGDGIRAGTEQCDDHNKTDGDGCSNDCVIEEGYDCIINDNENVGDGDICTAICGDGFVVDGVEECDDGNVDETLDGCSKECKINDGYMCSYNDSLKKDICWFKCGDKTRQGGELCDDGNLMNDDGCNSDCEIEEGYNCIISHNDNDPDVCTAICGDGFLVKNVEECDDNNNINEDGCNNKCMVEDGFVCIHDDMLGYDRCWFKCGDGMRQANEDCDDFNQVNGDGCNTECKLELGYYCNPIGGASLADECSTKCGDAILVEKTEECDDGNDFDDDGCDQYCRVEAGWSCQQIPGTNKDRCVKKVIGENVTNESNIDGNTILFGILGTMLFGSCIGFVIWKIKQRRRTYKSMDPFDVNENGVKPTLAEISSELAKLPPGVLPEVQPMAKRVTKLVRPTIKTISPEEEFDDEEALMFNQPEDEDFVASSPIHEGNLGVISDLDIDEVEDDQVILLVDDGKDMEYDVEQEESLTEARFNNLRAIDAIGSRTQKEIVNMVPPMIPNERNEMNLSDEERNKLREERLKVNLRLCKEMGILPPTPELTAIANNRHNIKHEIEDFSSECSDSLTNTSDFTIPPPPSHYSDKSVSPINHSSKRDTLRRQSSLGRASLKAKLQQEQQQQEQEHMQQKWTLDEQSDDVDAVSPVFVNEDGGEEVVDEEEGSSNDNSSDSGSNRSMNIHDKCSINHPDYDAENDIEHENDNK